MARDLTGQKFGKLTVIKRVEDYVYPNNKKHEPRWLCECDCEDHNKVMVIQHNLLNGHCHNCGCSNANNFIDLTGQKFGKLTVIKRVEDYVYNSGKKDIMWLCECDCDNHTKIVVRGHALKNGHTTSCGCAKVDAKFKHGGHGTAIYRIYRGMLNRCYDKNNSSYHRYGGRGIYVCDEWLDKNTGFIKFREFMIDNGYKENCNLSIDRIDNDGPYSPLNCRIATDKEQTNNRSSNVYITYNNETHTLSEWADISCVNYATFRNRLNLGWTMEKALNEPLTEASIYTSSSGESHTASEWSNILGIKIGNFNDRINAGWTIDKIIETPSKRN